MSLQTLVALLVALSFSAVHFLGAKLKFLRVTPRSIWLSIAGGVSVAYVFVHLLPDISEYQERFAQRLEGETGLIGAIETHVYVLALAGLLTFYGLDRLACSSASGRRQEGAESRPSDGVFWVHLGSFAIYNFLISYMLLHREEREVEGLLIYAFAMLLHFVVNDHSLREHHGKLYDHRGRWILAAMPITGWALGASTEISSMLVFAILSFLGGGIVLNVLKEEIPHERESRFWAFGLGTAAYAALLLST